MNRASLNSFVNGFHCYWSGLEAVVVPPLSRNVVVTFPLRYICYSDLSVLLVFVLPAAVLLTSPL